MLQISNFENLWGRNYTFTKELQIQAKMNKIHAKVEVPMPNQNTKHISLGFQCNLTEIIAKIARKPVFKSKFRSLCTFVWNYPNYL